MCGKVLKSVEKCRDDFALYREAPVRFDSVTVWEGNGSSGSGFRFSVFQYC